jgi:ribosomal protein L37AE/L43A
MMAAVPNLQTMSASRSARLRDGICPTCGHYTRFRFVGEQRWPERVAVRLGVSPINRIWQCSHCQTTLSEHDIDGI